MPKLLSPILRSSSIGNKFAKSTRNRGVSPAQSEPYRDSKQKNQWSSIVEPPSNFSSMNEFQEYMDRNLKLSRNTRVRKGWYTGKTLQHSGYYFTDVEMDSNARTLLSNIDSVGAILKKISNGIYLRSKSGNMKNSIEVPVSLTFVKPLVSVLDDLSRSPDNFIRLHLSTDFVQMMQEASEYINSLENSSIPIKEFMPILLSLLRLVGSVPVQMRDYFYNLAIIRALFQALFTSFRSTIYRENPEVIKQILVAAASTGCCPPAVTSACSVMMFLHLSPELHYNLPEKNVKAADAVTAVAQHLRVYAREFGGLYTQFFGQLSKQEMDTLFTGLIAQYLAIAPPMPSAEDAAAVLTAMSEMQMPEHIFGPLFSACIRRILHHAVLDGSFALIVPYISVEERVARSRAPVHGEVQQDVVVFPIVKRFAAELDSEFNSHPAAMSLPPLHPTTKNLTNQFAIPPPASTSPNTTLASSQNNLNGNNPSDNPFTHTLFLNALGSSGYFATEAYLTRLVSSRTRGQDVELPSPSEVCKESQSPPAGVKRANSSLVPALTTSAALSAAPADFSQSARPNATLLGRTAAVLGALGRTPSHVPIVATRGLPVSLPTSKPTEAENVSLEINMKEVLGFDLAASIRSNLEAEDPASGLDVLLDAFLNEKSEEVVSPVPPQFISPSLLRQMSEVPDPHPAVLNAKKESIHETFTTALTHLGVNTAHTDSEPRFTHTLHAAVASLDSVGPPKADSAALATLSHHKSASPTAGFSDNANNKNEAPDLENSISVDQDAFVWTSHSPSIPFLDASFASNAASPDVPLKSLEKQMLEQTLSKSFASSLRHPLSGLSSTLGSKIYQRSPSSLAPQQVPVAMHRTLGAALGPMISELEHRGACNSGALAAPAVRAQLFWHSGIYLAPLLFGDAPAFVASSSSLKRPQGPCWDKHVLSSDISAAERLFRQRALDLVYSAPLHVLLPLLSLIQGSLCDLPLDGCLPLSNFRSNVTDSGESLSETDQLECVRILPSALTLLYHSNVLAHVAPAPPLLRAASLVLAGSSQPMIEDDVDLGTSIVSSVTNIAKFLVAATPGHILNGYALESWGMLPPPPPESRHLIFPKETLEFDKLPVPIVSDSSTEGTRSISDSKGNKTTGAPGINNNVNVSNLGEAVTSKESHLGRSFNALLGSPAIRGVSPSSSRLGTRGPELLQQAGDSLALLCSSLPTLLSPLLVSQLSLSSLLASVLAVSAGGGAPGHLMHHLLYALVGSRMQRQALACLIRKKVSQQLASDFGETGSSGAPKSPSRSLYESHQALFQLLSPEPHNAPSLDEDPHLARRELSSFDGLELLSPGLLVDAVACLSLSYTGGQQGLRAQSQRADNTPENGLWCHPRILHSRHGMPADLLLELRLAQLDRFKQLTGLDVQPPEGTDGSQKERAVDTEENWRKLGEELGIRFPLINDDFYEFLPYFSGPSVGFRKIQSTSSLNRKSENSEDGEGEEFNENINSDDGEEQDSTIDVLSNLRSVYDPFQQASRPTALFRPNMSMQRTHSLLWSTMHRSLSNSGIPLLEAAAGPRIGSNWLSGRNPPLPPALSRQTLAGAYNGAFTTALLFPKIEHSSLPRAAMHAVRAGSQLSACSAPVASLALAATLDLLALHADKLAPAQVASVLHAAAAADVVHEPMLHAGASMLLASRSAALLEQLRVTGGLAAPLHQLEAAMLREVTDLGLFRSHYGAVHAFVRSKWLVLRASTPKSDSLLSNADISSDSTTSDTQQEDVEKSALYLAPECFPNGGESEADCESTFPALELDRLGASRARVMTADNLLLHSHISLLSDQSLALLASACSMTQAFAAYPLVHAGVRLTKSSLAAHDSACVEAPGFSWGHSAPVALVDQRAVILSQRIAAEGSSSAHDDISDVQNEEDAESESSDEEIQGKERERQKPHAHLQDQFVSVNSPIPSIPSSLSFVSLSVPPLLPLATRVLTPFFSGSGLTVDLMYARNDYLVYTQSLSPIAPQQRLLGVLGLLAAARAPERSLWSFRNTVRTLLLDYLRFVKSHRARIQYPHSSLPPVEGRVRDTSGLPLERRALGSLFVDGQPLVVPPSSEAIQRVMMLLDSWGIDDYNSGLFSNLLPPPSSDSASSSVTHNASSSISSGGESESDGESDESKGIDSAYSPQYIQSVLSIDSMNRPSISSLETLVNVLGILAPFPLPSSTPRSEKATPDHIASFNRSPSHSHSSTSTQSSKPKIESLSDEITHQQLHESSLSLTMLSREAQRASLPRSVRDTPRTVSDYADVSPPVLLSLAADRLLQLRPFTALVPSMVALWPVVPAEVVACSTEASHSLESSPRALSAYSSSVSSVNKDVLVVDRADPSFKSPFPSSQFLEESDPNLNLNVVRVLEPQAETLLQASRMFLSRVAASFPFSKESPLPQWRGLDSAGLSRFFTALQHTLEEMRAPGGPPELIAASAAAQDHLNKLLDLHFSIDQACLRLMKQQPPNSPFGLFNRSSTSGEKSLSGSVPSPATAPGAIVHFAGLAPVATWKALQTGGLLDPFHETAAARTGFEAQRRVDGRLRRRAMRQLDQRRLLGLLRDNGAAVAASAVAGLLLGSPSSSSGGIGFPFGNNGYSSTTTAASPASTTEGGNTIESVVSAEPTLPQDAFERYQNKPMALMNRGAAIAPPQFPPHLNLPGSNADDEVPDHFQVDASTLSSSSLTASKLRDPTGRFDGKGQSLTPVQRLQLGWVIFALFSLLPNPSTRLEDARSTLETLNKRALDRLTPAQRGFLADLVGGNAVAHRAFVSSPLYARKARVFIKDFLKPQSLYSTALGGDKKAARSTYELYQHSRHAWEAPRTAKLLDRALIGVPKPLSSFETGGASGSSSAKREDVPFIVPYSRFHTHHLAPSRVLRPSSRVPVLAALRNANKTMSESVHSGILSFSTPTSPDPRTKYFVPHALRVQRRKEREVLQDLLLLQHRPVRDQSPQADVRWRGIQEHFSNVRLGQRVAPPDILMYSFSLLREGLEARNRGAAPLFHSIIHKATSKITEKAIDRPTKNEGSEEEPDFVEEEKVRAFLKDLELPPPLSPRSDLRTAPEAMVAVPVLLRARRVALFLRGSEHFARRLVQISLDFHIRSGGHRDFFAEFESMQAEARRAVVWDLAAAAALDLSVAGPVDSNSEDSSLSWNSGPRISITEAQYRATVTSGLAQMGWQTVFVDTALMTNLDQLQRYSHLVDLIGLRVFGYSGLSGSASNAGPDLGAQLMEDIESGISIFQ